MKKISILVAICVIFATDVALGQQYTQHISFDDQVGTGNAGTYNSNDHFSVDLYLTFSGYRALGVSLWLATTANAAPHVFLTGFSYGTTFYDPTQPFVDPIGFTVQSGGLYTTPNPSDLGSSVDAPASANAVAPGTYFIGHLSVDLSGLPPGTYNLQTATASPHNSAVTRYDPTTDPFFFDEYLPAATYTVTVVPEPSTFALLIVPALGLGACICRRALSKRSYS